MEITRVDRWMANQFGSIGASLSIQRDREWESSWRTRPVSMQLVIIQDIKRVTMLFPEQRINFLPIRIDYLCWPIFATGGSHAQKRTQSRRRTNSPKKITAPVYVIPSKGLTIIATIKWKWSVQMGPVAKQRVGPKVRGIFLLKKIVLLAFKATRWENNESGRA